MGGDKVNDDERKKLLEALDKLLQCEETLRITITVKPSKTPKQQ